MPPDPAGTSLDDAVVLLYEDEARMLPRIQSGYPPQHLLLMLLGDYGLSVGEPIPSGSLVTLLDDFGVSVASARAALSRLARRGLLVATKGGRNTYYALTQRCAQVVAEGRRLTYGYTGLIDDWDGRQEALRRNLNVLGTLRVLADASDDGIVDLQVAVDRLRQTTFRASEELFQWLLAREKTKSDR
jgi:DNA-binding PadR family transcriptional regulator